MSDLIKARDTAEYLADMAGQLANLAEVHNLVACAALLGAAQREAERHRAMEEGRVSARKRAK